MTVTAIEDITRTRSRVFLDECLAFVLYKGELRQYHIKTGCELPDELYREIVEELLPRRAALRCMNLLKSRPYTESQLREKLRQGGYPDGAAGAALEYVKSYGYVDDRTYAGDYIANQQDKKSRRRIADDLIRKGISRETVEEAFSAQEEMGNTPDDEKLARQWLERKHYDADLADYREKQKMAAFLYRKGINAGTVRKVLAVEQSSEYGF